MSQFLLHSGTVELPAVGKIELGRDSLAAVTIPKRLLGSASLACVNLRNALVAWQ
jgi:hypothetical protein